MRKRLLVLAAGVVGGLGCGKESKDAPGGGGGGGKAAAVEKYVRPPGDSPACAALVKVAGSRARCVEVEQPQLASKAGKVFRVHDDSDPVRQPYLALVPAAGGDVVLEKPSRDSKIVGAILAAEGASIAPALVAEAYAALLLGSAVVRCLPGANDSLGEGEGACDPPAAGQHEGKPVVTAVIEEFPHPWEQNVWYALDRELLTVTETMIIGSTDSTQISKSDDGYSPIHERPERLPPLPAMTKAPDWAMTPEAAPADLSKELCDAIDGQFTTFSLRGCQAFHYPEMKLPTGTLYYIANESGQPDTWALKKSDGGIVYSNDLEPHSGGQSPIAPLFEDPSKVPPETLLAAFLTTNYIPAKIRCLPGKDDKLPGGAKCEAPTATKEGDSVKLTGIVETLPVWQPNGGQAHAIVKGDWLVQADGKANAMPQTLVALE